MAKYDVCPMCGAYLDHGEVCDCNKEETQEGYGCKGNETTE